MERTMGDYKYEMQLLAEQTAEEVYGKDFYELPQNVQDKVYNGAITDWMNSKVAAAEALKDY